MTKKSSSKIDLQSSVAKAKEFAKSDDFFLSLIENIPTLVFVKEARDLRFVLFNKAGEELLGYSRNELIGRNDYDFFPKEQADFFVSKDRAVLAGREAIEIAEEPITTRHKGTRFLHTRKIPIYSPEGEATYLLGISIDITDRKIAEEERIKLFHNQAMMKMREGLLRRSMLLAEATSSLSSSLNYRKALQRLGPLLVPEVCDWCVLALEIDGRFERVVTHHADKEKSTLLQKLDILKRTSGVIDAAKYGQSRLYVDFTDDELIKEAASTEDFHLLKKVGACSYLVVPIRTRGRLLGALSIAMNDSGRKIDLDTQFWAEELGHRIGMAIENALLYESAQRAIALRDEFLSIASHELKTPVTSLRLQTQLQQRRFEKSPEKLDIEAIERLLESTMAQTERLAKLIDDMLDVSRIAHGKLSLTFEKVEMASLVRDVLDRFQDQLEAMDIKCSVLAKGKVQGDWDRYRIEQVITNLITNAIKYGGGKPIEILIDKVDGHAMVKVKDHGRGVAEENLNKIFERFERVTVARGAGGLGLGLYISKQIVDAHLGSLSVESRLDEGSTFTLRLPIN